MYALYIFKLDDLANDSILVTGKMHIIATCKKHVCKWIKRHIHAYISPILYTQLNIIIIIGSHGKPDFPFLKDVIPQPSKDMIMGASKMGASKDMIMGRPITMYPPKVTTPTFLK
jgi:hypothetical protein